MTKIRKLSKVTIDNVFEGAQHQSDYIMGLYYIIIPKNEFKDIKQIHGWPEISNTTSEYIFKLAIAWDRKDNLHLNSRDQYIPGDD